MKLRDYIHFNRVKSKDLAEKLEIHVNYLRLIKNGHAIPSEKLCRHIEILTGGEVTQKDLRPI